MPKQPFPSERQTYCRGLSRGVYPAYLRDQVDYDYVDKLSDTERQWLAAFTEEYLRGWWVKAETQVHPVDLLRQSNAAHQRLRRHQDPLAFASVRDDIAHELLREEAEKPSRGHAEDQIVAAIDQRRRRERG